MQFLCHYINIFLHNMMPQITLIIVKYVLIVGSIQNRRNLSACRYFKFKYLTLLACRANIWRICQLVTWLWRHVKNKQPSEYLQIVNTGFKLINKFTNVWNPYNINTPLVQNALYTVNRCKKVRGAWLASCYCMGFQNFVVSTFITI